MDMASFRFNFSKPKTRDFSSFFRIFQSFIEGGNTVTDSLHHLRTKNKVLQKTVENLRDNIEDGMTVGEAFEKEAQVFPKYAVSVIKAGSQRNQFKEALINIGEYLKQERRFERKIYTSIRDIKMNCIMYTMAAFFITKFYMPNMMKSGFKADDGSGSIVYMLIKAFQVFDQYFFIIVGGLLGLIFCAYKIHKKSPYWGDLAMFKIPLYKEVYYYKIQYRFATIFAMLYGIGLGSAEILYHMSKVINNAAFSKVLLDAMQYNQDGLNLVDSLKRADEGTHLIDQTLLFHLQSGEKNNDVKKQLMYASQLYFDCIQESVEDYTKNISGIVICLATIFVGCSYIVVYGPYLEVGHNYLDMIKAH